jgi:DNA-binding response OmpR family regulator
MRILIVEDAKEISSLLKRALSADFLSVDVAEDGKKGSELARTVSYDLLILDNILPKKTGREIVREVRKSGKQMPILMLSVKTDTDSKVELLNAGADDYLEKPFSMAELVARVRALLRRPTNIETDILSIDNLVLDSKKQTVSRDNKKISLTKKEFMILEHLMRHQGTVLTRGMLLEHVWDMKTDPFSRTIEVHMTSLRRKIDTLGKRKFIHTLSSRGYKIDIDEMA